MTRDEQAELKWRRLRMDEVIAEIDNYDGPTDPAELPEDETGRNILDRIRALMQGDKPEELAVAEARPHDDEALRCVCKPDCCLGEGDPPNQCEHCATIDGELPCPIADAEPVTGVDRG